MTPVVTLPIALAVDLLAVVLLRRGLGLGRDASIAAAVAITVIAWVVATRLVDAVTRRRSDAETPPG